MFWVQCNDMLDVDICSCWRVSVLQGLDGFQHLFSTVRQCYHPRFLSVLPPLCLSIIILCVFVSFHISVSSSRYSSQMNPSLSCSHTYILSFALGSTAPTVCSAALAVCISPILHHGSWAQHGAVRCPSSAGLDRARHDRTSVCSQKQMKAKLWPPVTGARWISRVVCKKNNNNNTGTDCSTVGYVLHMLSACAMLWVQYVKTGWRGTPVIS